MQTIDLNVDGGESYGDWTKGQDEVLLQYVSSLNLACGFHAGDPLTISRTVLAAQAAGVRVGAHPSFPDLVGFGRRAMNLSYEEVYSDLLYQLGALSGFLVVNDMKLQHVKPHGALVWSIQVDSCGGPGHSGF